MGFNRSAKFADPASPLFTSIPKVDYNKIEFDIVFNLRYKSLRNAFLSKLL